MPAARLLLPVLALIALSLPAQAKLPNLRELAPVAAAYAAKIAASALFVSHRPLDSVRREELAPDGALEQVLAPLLHFEVDDKNRTVTCSLLGSTAVAAWIDGLGCTLLRDGDLASLRARGGAVPPPLPPLPHDVPWPRGEGPVGELPDDVDAALLQRALDAAFAEPEGAKVNTRAVVIARRGRLLAERYADGYDATMPLPGWSMSKTVALLLLGMRVRDGALREGALPVPEWRSADDPRHGITFDQLLRMQSGLEWRESYDDPGSPALRMLFGAADYGAVAAAQPLAHPPGTEHRYSSGTTNLLCRELRRTFACDADYWRYPRLLFDAMQARSMMLETDPSGTFVGSSFGFATARDWARLGQFLLQDGVVDGHRLLPEGWLAAARQPTAGSRGQFGRHLWLNAPADPDRPDSREWPDLPADLFHLDGHEGQYVFVLPQQQLIIVRLGCIKRGRFDLHGLLRAVLDACAPPIKAR